MKNNEHLKEEYKRLLDLHDLTLSNYGLIPAEAFTNFLQGMINASSNITWRTLPQDWARKCTNESLKRLSQEEGFNHLIQEISDEVESAIEFQKLTIPFPVFAAEYPIGIFNAEAKSVSGGILILVNTGLFSFIYHFIKIMSGSMRFVDMDKTGSAREESDYGDSGLSQHQIVTCLCDLIIKYLCFLNPLEAGPVPEPSIEKIAIIGTLTRGIERFVIAHEYGHVIAGHVKPTNSYKTRSGLKSNEFELTWNQEREADYIACEITLGAAYYVEKQISGLIDDKELLRYFVIQQLIAAPLLFFAIEEMIRRVVEEINGKPIALTDHPPPSIRAIAIKNYFSNVVGDDFMSLANAYLSWVKYNLDLVLKNLNIKK